MPFINHVHDPKLHHALPLAEARVVNCAGGEAGVGAAEGAIGFSAASSACTRAISPSRVERSLAFSSRSSPTSDRSAATSPCGAGETPRSPTVTEETPMSGQPREETEKQEAGGRTDE